MNLVQLERIVFIANVGSITEAAKQLYISQSALSQMVNAVEMRSAPRSSTAASSFCV